MATKSKSAERSITPELAKYVAAALRRRLPTEVVERAKHHVLDTIAAMVCGTTLKPGVKALSYTKRLGGTADAGVVGTRLSTTVLNAAFANGISAHADESNDFHAGSYTQPGCSIVPAALATAELTRASGADFLKAVVLGYDVGCRPTKALDPLQFHKEGHCTHSYAGTFGSAAAAGALLRVPRDEFPYVFAYAAQQASGCSCSSRDKEHMGKAFDFGGMPARNGVTAATLVAHGFTGVDDIFAGERNFFFAYSSRAQPQEMIRGLGIDYEILDTSLKMYPVGSVIQPPLESLRALIVEHGLKARDVEKMTVWITQEDAGVVNKRTMPNINLQYLTAVMLIDGDLTFATSHDVARMKSKSLLEVQNRIDLQGSVELSASAIPRQGIVEILTRDGRRLKHHTLYMKGSPRNRMTRAEVETKVLELAAPVLGEKRTRALIRAIWNVDAVSDVRALRKYYSA